MSDRIRELRSRYDGAKELVLWGAFALSLLLHLAALWTWEPQMRPLSLENAERGEARGSLAVQMAPRPSPPISSPQAPPPSAALQTRPAPRQAAPPKAAARPPSKPAVIARTQPVPNIPSTPPTAPSAAAPPAPPAEGDLTSYIEAKRRARAESEAAASRGSLSDTPPVEDDEARRDRIIAANLGLQRTPTFGYDPRSGGGIFRIQRMGYDDAEFIFFGWNKDIRRSTKQLIEVRKGDNSDIRIAVIRRMIAIIREHESGDFLWVSRRLGREITLSARPRDNAGLEDFMMLELFAEARLPQ